MIRIVFIYLIGCYVVYIVSLFRTASEVREQEEARERLESCQAIDPDATWQPATRYVPSGCFKDDADGFPRRVYR